METDKQEVKQERFDHDGFWKDFIKRFWREMLKRTLPDLYADADLSKEPKFLDTALRDTLFTPGAEEHNFAKFVDQLIEIPLKNGHYRLILLHIEIQGPGGEDISFRMVTYCCLIFSHYQREPVALAILTSPRPNETLGVYESSQYGTRHIYHYNCFELYNQDEEELLASDNPFDLVLYAAKKAALCKNEEQQKFTYLLQLTRLMSEKGWSAEDRKDVLVFIERIINLQNRELFEQYVAEFMKMKGEPNMAYVSFIEEYFRNEGRAEGRAEGKAEGRTEGEYQARLEMAQKMQAGGMPPQDILKYTGLSCDDLPCPQSV